MATWLELKQQVLLMLDQSSSTTGDLATQVENALTNVVEELVVDARPEELLTEVGPFNITSATTSVSLSTDFVVTDLDHIYALSVDDKSGSDRDDKVWKEVSWPAWRKFNHQVGGNLRPRSSWTKDPDDDFYLVEWPSGSETWDLYLTYYKTPTAFADGGTPELPSLYHRVLPLGAIRFFPQYFQGEKQILLSMYAREYNEAKKRLLRNRTPDLKLRPKKVAQSSGKIVWPGFQTS